MNEIIFPTGRRVQFTNDEMVFLKIELIRKLKKEDKLFRNYVIKKRNLIGNGIHKD